MGQGNTAKGNAVVGFAADEVAQAEGAADDEGDFTAAVQGQFGKGRCQIFRGYEFPLYIQGEEVRALADVAQHLLPFFVEDLGLLGRRRILRHLLFRKDGHFDLAIRAQALQKLVDAGGEVFLFDLADGNDMILHQLVPSPWSDESFCGLSWRTTVTSWSEPLRV